MTLDSYPAETARFLHEQGDRFRNPVGSTITRELEELYDALVALSLPAAALESPASVAARDAAWKGIAEGLQEIVRIRAVQDFSAAQAVAFVFSLKQAIREELAQGADEQPAGPLAAVEDRIDEMALLAFDLFMRCREKIYEIKANELKNRTAILLRRMGEIPTGKNDPVDK